MGQDNAMNSKNSNSRAGNYYSQNLSQANNDPTGGRSYDNFLHLSSNNNSPKRNPDRKNSLENESESGNKGADEDEEYNIYSDIEEEDKSKAPPENELEAESAVMMMTTKEKDRDSDSDMVIDEDRVGVISKVRDRDSRSSAESASKIEERRGSRGEIGGTGGGGGASTFPDIVSEKTTEPVVVLDIPSPTSIPLPDSPPPPSAMVNSVEDEEDEILILSKDESNLPMSKTTNQKLPYRNSRVSKAREEYDPSQPLNSSEEEDDDLEIQLPPQNQNTNLTLRNQSQLVQPPSNINLAPHSQTKVADDESDTVGVSAIPMPNDEYKRPTIQFSIPTRHKLLPISSLIKRQKGVVRKESKSALSFTSEISKAFGEDKQEESDDESKGNGNEPKMSLVAEIFGSDDEEDKFKSAEESEPTDTSNKIPVSKPDVPDSCMPSLPVPIPTVELEDQLSVASIPSINPLDSTSRWKKIVVEDTATEVQEDPLVETDVTEPKEVTVPDPVPVSLDHESSNDSISVVEMIEKTKSNISNLDIDNEEIQVVSVTPADPEKRAKDTGRRPRMSADKPAILESISEGDSEFDSSRGESGSGYRRKSKKDKDRAKDKDKDKKGGKRKRSFSPVNNREEGEIIDSPEKRRKKKKEKKKSKKRRRSKDDKPRIDFSEKKVSDVAPALHNSSEEENIGDNLIEWRKPSNSAKERNYRDGKPKPEEKYFRPRDKKQDPSPRERRDKHIREKSPSFNKDKSFKERNDLRRSRRRSTGRSRSRSYSRGRNLRRFRSRSNRSSVSSRSFHSRSRSRSQKRHSKRGRFSVTPRKSRSGSRTPLKTRSRSPFRRSRNRKRSLSNNRSRRFKGRKRSGSSTSSVSSKRSKRKRKEKNGGGAEKTKKKREKEKDKLPEPRDVEDKEKDREKDKEKKKRKKKREKSVSPAKEIFADGDSIVVSLNFQKGGATSFPPSGANEGESPARSNTGNEKRKSGRNRTRKRSGEKDETGKPRLLKKTLLIDLETSPVQEQNIGVSPTLIVLSDDEEGEAGKGKETDSKDSQDGAAVSTSCSNGQNEGTSPYRHGVAADSTQIHHPNQSDSKLDDSSFSVSICASISPFEGSNLSPNTRGDSLVTSTRDSEMGLQHDDDSRSPSLSPSLKPSENKILHQPHSPEGSPLPPLPPGSPPAHDSRSENAGTPTSSASSHLSNHQNSLPSVPGPGKPIIGNIPGLFPSSTASSNVNIPPPIVIPTPPNPQLRFPPAANQNILTPNVLASVASAFLAARQQQQSSIPGKFLVPPGGTNVIGNKVSQQGSVLLPKNQNSHSITHGSSVRTKVNSSGLSTGDGDSPFSPNSSEGDDLFEPPLERSQMDSSGKLEKLSGNQTSNSLSSTGASGNIGNSGGKPRDKHLFDSLFGTPSKKSSAHHKSHDKPVKMKNAAHHKSKSKRAAKKEIPKLTEGELRQTEEVPTSAVELRVKEKFLKKLNRQERVVEEVKLSLKPHYSKKHVTKDEYKEILRRAVPKICHNKSGEINPFKIKELVEAYVKKFRHSRKKEVSSS